MCTLAWGTKKGRLWACFNRDEQRSRPEAELPRMVGKPGHRRVYARDPLGGGSWFVAAEEGFAVALLNHHPDGWSSEKVYPQSRGQLVLEASRIPGEDGIRSLLQANHLRSYPPFHLFILKQRDSLAFTWDGSSLKKVTCPQEFITTSSFRQESIIPWREQWWKEQTAGMDLDDASAAELLRQCDVENPAWGTTMDREDARTVSQIQLRMEGTRFRFLYSQRDPEGKGFLQPVILTCRTGSS